uniref:Aspartic peptidase DDI1-type domain-containing protein n=1 Tax=Brassica oleracea var. oleracea TaxID=109376 RepID=A0A0D3E9S5_BRAOL
MDLLLSDRAKQEKVNFVGEQKQEETVVVHEVDGLEGQEEILESQTRSEKHIGYELKNLHTKVDGSYNDLNNKFLQLSSHFKALENQFSSMPSTSKRPMRSLLGKLEQNPKEYCNVILSTTSSEIELSDHEKEIVDKIEHKAMERVKAHAELKVAAENLKSDEHKAENQVEREVVHRLKEVKLKGTTEVEQSPYDKLPFPQRVLTKAQKKVISKFRKDMSAVGVKLQEIPHMRDAHVQMMLIRDILPHKEEVAELLDISTMQLDPPVTPKSIPKLETQGQFTLSCSLGKFTLDDALVDSGASVNVISMEMKKMMKEPHPPPLDMMPHTLTLHPMKFKDGAIEYKIKCKGKSTPFSSAKAIITPQLQDDPIKLQELLSQVLTITLESGKNRPSPLSA